MIIIISPIVIIAVVVAIILASHIVITGAMLVTALTILGVSLVATAGIIYGITTRHKPSLRDYRPTYSAEELPPSMPSPGPLPRAHRESIEGPREIHNHIHLDGLNPDQVAEYLRHIGRESNR